MARAPAKVVKKPTKDSLIGFRTDEATRTALDRIAARDGVSLGAVLRAVVEGFLASQRPARRGGRRP